MTASLAYSATPMSKLTGAQLTAPSTALLRELRRLAPGTTRTANRQDVRTQVRMRLIRNALKRIRAGSYGACLMCQSLIPYEHLAVIPETQTRVRCASG
jgi:RNA polymerase-binding transcription factor DksA